ncbi:uncharacterized protein IWZ02DRAFT_437490 [Phyllosticta citriasiana]|uniref:uncharacterized protein n=1 Tax=Phyllosticta citriasiana TaxID=595635 RepID=UPI0030FD3442
MRELAEYWPRDSTEQIASSRFAPGAWDNSRRADILILRSHPQQTNNPLIFSPSASFAPTDKMAGHHHQTQLHLRVDRLRGRLWLAAVTQEAYTRRNRAFDTASDSLWNNINKGRQWKDIKHQYLEKEDDDE